mmetsp:Transcript_1097/g.2214  ORF Transcript_1097/g.2214 Transcript_1097/m.2214 type:complete len:166 (+) Transcript_1097:347-844(+)
MTLTITTAVAKTIQIIMSRTRPFFLRLSVTIFQSLSIGHSKQRWCKTAEILSNFIASQLLIFQKLAAKACLPNNNGYNRRKMVVMKKCCERLLQIARVIMRNQAMKSTDPLSHSSFHCRANTAGLIPFENVASSIQIVGDLKHSFQKLNLPSSGGARKDGSSTNN